MIPLNVLENELCEEFARGITKNELANTYGLPVKEVRKILNKPQAKELIGSLVEVAKENRIALLNRIISDKVKRHLENNEDLSNFSNKDPLELIKVLDDMLKEQEKADLGIGDNNYINIIQGMVSN